MVVKVLWHFNSWLSQAAASTSKLTLKSRLKSFLPNQLDLRLPDRHKPLQSRRRADRQKLDTFWLEEDAVDQIWLESLPLRIGNTSTHSAVMMNTQTQWRSRTTSQCNLLWRATTLQSEITSLKAKWSGLPSYVRVWQLLSCSKLHNLLGFPSLDYLQCTLNPTNSYTRARWSLRFHQYPS